MMRRARTGSGRTRRHPAAATAVLAALLAAPHAALLAQPAPSAAPAPEPTIPAFPGPGADLDEPLPVSPEVTVGELENGLRYYIRENREPENRAMLRLVVDAGSVLEDPDQRGVAHVLEHMAFNGTERFEKQELVAFMESIGMPLGPGLNASTSFDETVYMLNVPTDEPAHLETALRIINDWIGGLTLDPDEIENERRVVIEEWRGNLGASSRARDLHLPVVLRGSRYAERLPIGTLRSLETFEHDALKRFYRDWYRPDLMAVVAVGDFDAARIEAMIRDRFERLSTPEDPRERPEFDLPEHDETLFSIVADSEMPGTTVEIYHKMAPDRDDTVGGFRRRIVEHLYNYLLNQRFQEIARQPDPPFRAAASMHGRLVRSGGVYMLRAQVPDDGIEQGLEILITESERVARHGFTESELERGRLGILREIQRRYANRDNRNSAAFAGEYIGAFLNDAPIPGLEYERALYQRFVPGIELEEINRVGERWIRDTSRVVLVTGPERDGAPMPEENALAAVLDEAANARVEAYAEEASDGVLLQSPPTGSEVVATRTRDGGLTEWDLANGVRVVLKPTDFGGDEVRFAAFGPGGTTLAAEEDIVAARTAASVVHGGGAGTLSATALQRALAGHVVDVNAYIGEFDHGVVGRASAEDLPKMFELVYLRLTAPRADESAFESLMDRQRLALANRDRSPQTAFNDAFGRIMNSGHPHRRPITADMLDEADLERSLAFYEDRFADASDLTFVFVGTFDPETIRPLVEQYLGGLPADARQQATSDVRFELPRGTIEETVRRGVEPRSQSRIAFPPPPDFAARDEDALMTATSELLQTRLRNVLREELGGTYSVSVRPLAFRQPEPVFVPVIEFASAPERADELVETIYGELEALAQDGPGESLVADVRESMLRSHETRMRQDGFWLSSLIQSYRYDAEPGAGALLAHRDAVEALAREDIRAAIGRYFDADDRVRVTLMPER